jgi:hypothetical protein
MYRPLAVPARDLDHGVRGVIGPLGKSHPGRILRAGVNYAPRRAAQAVGEGPAQSD